MKDIWYLAHPVASDRHYSEKENMAHALKCAEAVWEAGFRLIMPWHSHCLFQNDSNPAQRAAGMKLNCAVVEACRGVILTGHRLSRGMEEELRVAREAIDLIGVRTRFYGDVLHATTPMSPMQIITLHSQRSATLL